MTGVVPTARDLAVWKEREKPPLVPLNEVNITPEDEPVIPADGERAEENTEPTTWQGNSGGRS